MKYLLDLILLLPLLIVFSIESLVKLFIPKKKKSVAGEIVLITGAGHGIGRLTAYEFAKLNTKLVLWDINKNGIEETAAKCRKLGAQAHPFVVDCSQREEIYSAAKKVKEEVGDVSILVNNAGVVYTADLFATQDPQIEKTFEVNVLAHFCHGRGPRGRARGSMLDFAIFAVTFLLALVGAVLYLYPASRQASGIPGLTPTEEKDGNLPDIVNSGSLHEFLVNLHERYGPVVSFWFGRRLVVSLGTTDVLKQHFNPNKTSDPFETMLKSLLGYQSGGGSAGEDHVRRKLYGDAVTASLHSNFPLLLQLSEELLDKWLSYPETQHIPLSQHMLGFALKFVTRMVLGSTFEDEQEVIRFQKIHGTVWSEIGKGFLDGSLDKNTTRKKQYQEALMQLESTLKKIIKERKGGNFRQHTFIDSLTQGKLNEQQILEDCVVFSLASCIITARLCTWTIHFLTTTGEVQKKLCKEIDQVLGEGPITSEKIEQLSYCQQVLFETVRTAKLTPVSARLQDIEGKVGPFVIPKETLVLYALGVVLQDPSTWPLPHRFDPDRFADEPVMKVFSSLGFSGTWECPELRFAYMVTAVLVSVLLKRLRLLAVDRQVFEMKYELVTSAREEAWITVSKRH